VNGIEIFVKGRNGDDTFVPQALQDLHSLLKKDAEICPVVRDQLG